MFRMRNVLFILCALAALAIGAGCDGNDNSGYSSDHEARMREQSKWMRDTRDQNSQFQRQARANAQNHVTQMQARSNQQRQAQVSRLSR